MIERKSVRFFLCEKLNREFPLGEIARNDGVEHIASVEVLISAGNLDGFIPNGGLQAELGAPVEFDEGGFAGSVNQPETMHPKAFDHPQRTRYCAIGHDPHHRMHGFRRVRNEIPERVVRGRRLWKAAVGFHLYGMDEVGEFDGILDEENWDVVADQVPVAFLGVKLDGKPAYVTRGIDRTRAACDGRYASKYGRLLTHLGEYPGGGVLLQRDGQLEESMGARRTRVYDTLGNTLVIEMGDFFAEDEILQQRRAARIGPERVLIIGKCEALVRGEGGVTSTRDLVQLAAGGQMCGCIRDRALFLFSLSRITHFLFFAHNLSP